MCIRLKVCASTPLLSIVDCFEHTSMGVTGWLPFRHLSKLDLEASMTRHCGIVTHCAGSRSRFVSEPCAAKPTLRHISVLCGKAACEQAQPVSASC